MTQKQDDDDRPPAEAEHRLQKILKGAFAGPPTPLKDIPTRSGESRSIAKKKPQRRRLAASARSGRPEA
jgi:hypothetical protein